ncbi:MAG: alpha/beta hydrolase [Alphaproteobacteria bacterium]|nr:alpha/beta hydrolase [Alphaproteobacteria bacterium]
MNHGTVETADVTIHYVTQGAGPDIVWIPGGDQKGEDWAEQMAAFPEYRNISYDPRGAGRTKCRPAPPWPIPAFADDCAALIRAVAKPPVILIGLSMGALIVQEMICEHPELVRLAIAMGTSGTKGGYLLEWEDAEIRFARSGATLPNDFAIAHYALLMYPSEVLGDDALWAKVKPVVEAAYKDRDGAMLAAQWQACVEYSAMERLPRCTVPLHVIGFSQDMQTPPARGRRVAAAAGNGTFHLLEGLGHCSMFGHKPEVVNAKLREIVAAHG